MTTTKSSRHVQRRLAKAEAHRSIFPGEGEDLRGLLKKPPATAPMLDWATQLATHVLELGSVFERESPMLSVAARILGQAHLGLLLLGSRPAGTKVVFPFGDGEAIVPALGDQSGADASTWTKAWYGAVIARDAQCLAALRHVPLQELARSAELDGYHDAWNQALLALDTEPERAAGWAERAAALTSKEHATLAAPGIPELAGAVFKTLHGVARRDVTAFNDALLGALQAHEKYWSREPADPRGWVAIAATALACRAHDVGIPVQVDSDYLLPSLIRTTSIAHSKMASTPT